MEIAEIKESLDLVAIVEAAGVDLKRSGSRHIGLCPFHPDEAPSFFVFDDNRFKCFGCGEHGDVIDFVKKYHGVDFKGALRILGIEQGPVTPEKRQEVKRLQHRRELVKAFRGWEVEAADKAAMLCRYYREVLGKIRTLDDLNKHGERYHSLESYQYHLSIFVGNNDPAKFELWKANYYG